MAAPAAPQETLGRTYTTFNLSVMIYHRPDTGEIGRIEWLCGRQEGGKVTIINPSGRTWSKEIRFGAGNVSVPSGFSKGSSVQVRDPL